MKKIAIRLLIASIIKVTIRLLIASFMIVCFTLILFGKDDFPLIQLKELWIGVSLILSIHWLFVLHTKPPKSKLLVALMESGVAILTLVVAGQLVRDLYIVPDREYVGTIIGSLFGTLWMVKDHLKDNPRYKALNFAFSFIG